MVPKKDIFFYRRREKTTDADDACGTGDTDGTDGTGCTDDTDNADETMTLMVYLDILNSCSNVQSVT